MKRLTILALTLYYICGCGTPQKAFLVESTDGQLWTEQIAVPVKSTSGKADVIIDESKTLQEIKGFGACFNELGWTSLKELGDKDIQDIFHELFSPGAGANLLDCRMPVGANDFAVDWYSYNETEGDFDMKDFDISHDKETLIPFILEAKKYQPDLKVWASPWSPPSWMKHNKHYASRPTSKYPADNKTLINGESKEVDNGLPESREGFEGTDMFIQQPEYLKAYALYFSKFIDAYKEEGIDIYAVMPQNEFNSPQIFPSCCWKASSLAGFIGKYLGPAMSEKGVEILFGTMERPAHELVDTILNDAAASKYVKGVGFQWAGKESIEAIHNKYPELLLYQTEQECGNGRNTWNAAMYSWDLMRHYLSNGVSVYDYWNISLLEGGISRWGWAQNSFVVVNKETREYRFTPEYYIMKHFSHFVLPGAKMLDISGQHKDVLAFINKDKSITVVAANQQKEPQTITVRVSGKDYTLDLKPRSVNTLFIK